MILLTQDLNAIVFINSSVFLLTVESDLCLGEGEMAEPLPRENGNEKYKVDWVLVFGKLFPFCLVLYCSGWTGS